MSASLENSSSTATVRIINPVDASQLRHLHAEHRQTEHAYIFEGQFKAIDLHTVKGISGPVQYSQPAFDYYIHGTFVSKDDTKGDIHIHLLAPPKSNDILSNLREPFQI
jgi:hypothetical protein